MTPTREFQDSFFKTDPILGADLEKCHRILREEIFRFPDRDRKRDFRLEGDGLTLAAAKEVELLQPKGPKAGNGLVKIMADAVR